MTLTSFSSRGGGSLSSLPFAATSSLLLLLLALANRSLFPALAAAPPSDTTSAIAAEVSRLLSVAANLEADAGFRSKAGVVVHGETLQKPSKVPRALWPDLNSNSTYNPADVEQQNSRLSDASLVYGELYGIETPAFGADGTAYLPDNLGNIWRFPPPLGANTTGEIIARLPSRPLGVVVDQSVADPSVGLGNSLVVAVAGAGIFRVSLLAGPQGQHAVTLLTSYATAGEDPAYNANVPASASGRIMFANGVTVERATGAVFFTDSVFGAPPAPPPVPENGGAWDSLTMAYAVLYAGAATGRLAKYDPRDGRTVVISTGSWFANGVALADSATLQPGGDEGVAVMCETYSARLVRVDVSGQRAGEVRAFAPALPGYCDSVVAAPAATPATAAGVARAGTFWVAINTRPSSALTATALAASPALRWAASRSPQQLVDLVAPPFGLVVRVDASGKVVESLQDPSGRAVGRASSAVPSPDGSLLFMGSLTAYGLRFVKVAQ